MCKMYEVQICMLFCVFLFGNFVFGDNKMTYKTAGGKHQLSLKEVLEDKKVVLKPPSNLATFFTSATNIYLVWDPPEVYPIHDVNPDDTSWNDDPSTTPPTDNTTAQTPSDTSEDSTDPTEATTTSTLDNLTTADNARGDNSTAHILRNICRPYRYLYNRTEPGDYLNFEKADSTVQVHTINPDNPKKKEENLTSVVISISEAAVPFSQGCVEEYIIYVYDNKTGEVVQTKKLGGNQATEINITDLKANTSYELFIAAEFTSGHKLNSTRLVVTTKVDKNHRECNCNSAGTVGGRQPCKKDNTSLCHCKPGYKGLFCEMCQGGFYKTATFFPCHPCPCRSHSSAISSCHFVEGFLVCDKCRMGYTGTLCHQCANGYYRYQGKFCVPCRCHGNTDPHSKLVCDPYSGACSSCIRNTTGFNCERCRKGFKGDAIIYRNCTNESDLHHKNQLPLPAGYIAGIVIAVVLFFSFIVGFIVYKRIKYPTMKPFWTVELKEDHEGVNFSAVEDQEFLKAAERNSEGEFYEKQGGGRGMKYAQLREDI